jgi:hypothetical protein
VVLVLDIYADLGVDMYVLCDISMLLNPADKAIDTGWSDIVNYMVFDLFSFSHSKCLSNFNIDCGNDVLDSIIFKI